MSTNTLQATFLSALLLSSPVAHAVGESRLPDKPKPLTTEGVTRTAPIFEAGEAFLGTGNITQGWELPTGAVWHPQWLVWGDLRSAVQHFDNGATHSTEWANRLNLFGQLRLSGTERVLISFRPLDQNGEFSGYRFSPSDRDGEVNGLNAEIRSFYFEGDFGELFPNLDPQDYKKLDWGFAVGRQPVFKQEGMLINDTMDALGIVRNSIRLSGSSNLRITGFAAWNEVHRNNNREDETAELYGLFTEIDWACCTVNIDLAYVDADRTTGSGFYAGVSSVQRFGHFNSSLRALYSEALDDETAEVSTGTLLFSELSWTPYGTDDNIYVNTFVGIDEFSSASRDAATGGPLGRVGILFAAVGLGEYGAALGNRAENAYGAAIGYQKFMQGFRRQLIVEAGFRENHKGVDDGAIALGARLQQAIGRHTILVLDGFIGDRDATGTTNGLRSELRYKF